MNKKRRSIGVLVVSSIITVCLLLLLVIFLILKTEERDNNNGLPTLEIRLNNTTFQEIADGEKDIKYIGNDIVIKTGNRQLFLSDVTIKGRGNTTWKEPKKPFRISFSESQDLLGLGKSRKWALLANNLDDTLMRNDVAMYISGLLDARMSLKGEYVTLLIDGEYIGVYYISKIPEISKGVVNINDEYGVLVELDDYYCDGDSIAISLNNNCLVLKDAVNDDYAEDAFDDFVRKYNELERLAEIGDFEKIERIIDVESFAKYFLISEFSNNPDSYSTSWWMYKDGHDGKIVSSPVWDYDFAFGNKRWGSPDYAEDFYNPMLPMLRRVHAMGNDEQRDINVSKIMYQLMDNQEFRKTVENIYRDKLMNSRSEIVEYIRDLADRLRNDAKTDAETWGKKDFDEEVEYFVWWVENRFRMMDIEYGGMSLPLVKSVEI